MVVAIGRLTLLDMPMEFLGGIGDNETGCSIGGFERSASDCLVTGSRYTEYDGKDNISGAYNAYIIRCNLVDTPSVYYFTNYSKYSSVSCLPAKIVKLTDYQFLILWEEYNELSKDYETKAVRIDQFGNPVSDQASFRAVLSDCQPIVMADGTVSWIASSDSVPILYNINPYDLSQIGNQPDWYHEVKELKDIINDSVEIEDGDTAGWLVESDKDGNEIKRYVKDTQGLIYRINSGKDSVDVYSVADGIESLSVPKSIVVDGESYSVTKICKNAFSGYKSLKKIIIGKNVISIGENAF